MGKGSEHPKGLEATVEPLSQREHRLERDAFPEGDGERRKGVIMGRQRRNKTTQRRSGNSLTLLRAYQVKGRTRVS